LSKQEGCVGEWVKEGGYERCDYNKSHVCLKQERGEEVGRKVEGGKKGVGDAVVREGGIA